MQNSDKLEWPAINPNGDKRLNFFKPTWIFGTFSYSNSVLDQINNDLVNKYFDYLKGYHND